MSRTYRRKNISGEGLVKGAGFHQERLGTSAPWNGAVKEETRRKRRRDTKAQLLRGEDDVVSLEKKYKGIVSHYD